MASSYKYFAKCHLGKINKKIKFIDFISEVTLAKTVFVVISNKIFSSSFFSLKLAHNEANIIGMLLGLFQIEMRIFLNGSKRVVNLIYSILTRAISSG